jgi:hypothetical protein
MARQRQAGKDGTGQGNGQGWPHEPSGDHLWDALVENWPHILRMYRLCEHRRPIIVLYDIQERQVYVYPFAEFKAEMSEVSQRSLEEQQERADREGKFVVFIRDNEQRRLVSFSMDPE